MLISVAVISYNSSKTILDTLDSVLRQTYDPTNIELVISDDGSKDSTLNIINEWCHRHREIFSNIVVVESKKNVGVSGNCNAAWRACSGVWIKTIAADDILMDSCIELNAKFVNENPGVSILFSRVRAFSENVSESYPWGESEQFHTLSPNQQFQYLLRTNPVVAPSCFIRKQLLADVGYADERFPMIEDYPLWLKITKQGQKLYFMPSDTVYYRVGESLSLGGVRVGNLAYISSLYAFQRASIWPELGCLYGFKFLDDTVMYYQKYFGIRYMGNTAGNSYCVFRMLTNVLRPYRAFNIIVSNVGRWFK